MPNVGDYEAKSSWEPILDKFSGTELHDFLKKVSDGELTTALKPQYVDKLPKHHTGKVFELLGKLNENDELENIITELTLKHTLEC